MSDYLKKLLIKKYGTTDILNIPYKKIDETTEREQFCTAGCRDIRIGMGRFITPKEVKEKLQKVLNYKWPGSDKV